MGLDLNRHIFEYQAIKELHDLKNYSIKLMCDFFNVSRSAYYRWLKQPKSAQTIFNEHLADLVRYIYEADNDKGYRRIRDDLVQDFGLHVNDKRVLRICRNLQIKSTVKHHPNGITKAFNNPYHIAKNYLNRDFHADKPNEKWLTDVSEFKYTLENQVKKIYLSAILDLADRRIVSFIISDRNDNKLVFDTFDEAIRLEPKAHPLLHSDRGFQYTSKNMRTKIKNQGMKQSMSRVAHCIDNGPMEGFWGTLKREKYYRRKFTSREDLVSMIEDYINYYNNGRYQRCLKSKTPLQVHQQLLMAA
ncbi:IS3 family transposase [Enterococcus mundtii]|uniref:IS3 family transposase n=1 Tax=Enterococcus TaxID=1350 RepID=UPI0008EC9291|nr:IS3 family transposase [Enterococcus mundtii]SFL76229.1 Transposase InsO and inactivated derivatives [Enterococcus mundtii]SFM02175.1 Transposase InsO and inactivated derivatives [Enterococcus mundtii]SFM22944.1 Transposase InsO and inactivated derivatives [Enterococcus mundtii]